MMMDNLLMIESSHVELFFTPPGAICYIPKKHIRCVKIENYNRSIWIFPGNKSPYKLMKHIPVTTFHNLLLG